MQIAMASSPNAGGKSWNEQRRPTQVTKRAAMIHRLIHLDVHAAHEQYHNNNNNNNNDNASLHVCEMPFSLWFGATAQEAKSKSTLVLQAEITKRY